MSNTRDAALKFARENRERFLSELIDLLKIPSVSTDSTHKAEMHKAADWLVKKLLAIGMQKAEVMPTDGHPIVYAENLKAGDDAMTVMIYGHYDVQPEDPADLWKSPAFEPSVRDGKLFARGASDMKGQVMATLDSLEAVLKQGDLSYNVKFFIEGEEEIGSRNAEAFLDKHKDLLACDFVLNTDGGMIAADQPTITYGLRGLAYFEVHVSGPAQDLHSGLFGGSVRNPANELARLLGGMHDEKGGITLPGFYDSVRPLDEQEREELSRLPLDEAFYLKQTGAPALWGEDGFSPVERVGARPTLDVNGLSSGWTGEGTKTVLPAKAMAKLSARLVPDQTPKQVHEQLKAYMQANANSGVTWEVKLLDESAPAITSRDSKATQALSDALETVWGKRPVFKREGGTIGIVGHMQKYLNADSVLTGFGLPDDNLHSPNEKLDLENWYRGIDALVHFFYNVAE